MFQVFGRLLVKLDPSKMAHSYCRRQKMKVGAMDVTPYKFIWCGDIYGLKPYRCIGSRWAFIPQTLVVLPVPVPGFCDQFLGPLWPEVYVPDLSTHLSFLFVLFNFGRPGNRSGWLGDFASGPLGVDSEPPGRGFRGDVGPRKI
jgi:hypothetical protein